MVENGRRSSGRPGGESISTAAGAAGSAEARLPPPERRTRWRGCFGGVSCFGSQKGGKRIVPASRIAEVSTSGGNRGIGSQAVGHSIQAITLSLLAPPSSPMSFTNSALPSAAQSPRFLLPMSENSPVGPSSTMFVTGPYAHETQLVSPPVFSTYTTEPSTAPLTPPPELAHLTTPSSPEVPYARFLTSSADLKGASRKVNGVSLTSPGYGSNSGDLRAIYPFCPGSPSSSLITPASETPRTGLGTPRTGLSSPYPEQEIPSQWGTLSSLGSSPPISRHGLPKNLLLPTGGSSFFSPAACTQFYLDQAQISYPHRGAANSSVAKEEAAGIYSGGGGMHCKPNEQDVEEVEAYRASFGFSVDEIIATQKYAEASDGPPDDDSFTISPFLSSGNKRVDGWKAEAMLAGLMLDLRSSGMAAHPFATGQLRDSSKAAALPCHSFAGSGSEDEFGDKTHPHSGDTDRGEAAAISSQE